MYRGIINRNVRGILDMFTWIIIMIGIIFIAVGAWFAFKSDSGMFDKLIGVILAVIGVLIIIGNMFKLFKV